MKKLFLLTLLIVQTDFFALKPQTLYIEFTKAPSTEELRILKNKYQLISIKQFYSRAGDYWSRYFEAQAIYDISNQLTVEAFVARVEKPVAAQALSLEPSDNKDAISEDAFVRYQWALDNSGQKYFRDTDDIHPEVATSKIGLDLQWKELQKKLKSTTRRPIVAIVDSGLSYTHDEISHAVYKNDIECKNGSRIVNAEEDKDQNGFIGDCLGWNFTTEDKRRRNDVSDDIGHGTHIAGIIAAKANNVGVAGLWDQVQILPIKVYSNSQEADQQPYIQRVSKAILYAVDRKVDVINLSLGWPLLSDLPVARQAIQAALDANITIVAGAGNDGHTAKVLPCAYEGVICVGSTGLDGTLPGFSNYGGQVDILAPGEAILSIFPPLLTPRQFGVRKYNVMNGTSQSTPYVSAAAAILKAVYPSIKNDEIMARLRISSNTSDLNYGHKFSASGMLQPDTALMLQTQSYVAPIFKRIDLLFVDPKSGNLTIDLPIKNFWKSSSNIQVEIRSPQLSIEAPVFTIAKLQEGETQVIKVPARLLDLKTDFAVQIEVIIKDNNSKRSFRHESFLSIKPDSANYKLYAVQSKLQLQSVNDYNLTNVNAEFFTTNVKETGIELSVLEIENDQIKAKSTLFLEKAVALYPYIGVTRLDLNYDGKLDYFITAILKEGETSYIEHYALDTNLKPLLGKYSNWRFKDDGILIQQSSLQFVDYISQELGRIRVPAFMGTNVIPTQDQNPDPFEPYTINGKAIYVLQPQIIDSKVLLTTRLLNNYSRIADLSKQLSLRFNEEIAILYYDVNNGLIRTIVSAGLGVNLKYYFVEYEATAFNVKDVRPIQMNHLDLRYQVSRRINDTTIAFFGIFRNDMGQLNLLNTNSGEVRSFEVSSGSLKNGIVSLLAVNIKNDSVEAFVESVDSMILFTFSNNESKRDTKQIYRFSYLPGQFFTDLLFPIRISDNTNAIYVDSSSINARNIHLWIADEGLNIPIKYSVQLPENCRALNPRRMLANESFPSYVLLCNENNTYTVRQILIN